MRNIVFIRPIAKLPGNGNFTLRIALIIFLVFPFEVEIMNRNTRSVWKVFSQIILKQTVCPRLQRLSTFKYFLWDLSQDAFHFSKQSAKSSSEWPSNCPVWFFLVVFLLRPSSDQELPRGSSYLLLVLEEHSYAKQ